MKKTPKVTVVITTKNEKKNIENCLQSIKKQTYPTSKIQIIVVDNGSSDDTKKIARQYTRSVFNKGPERAMQRNYGLKKGNGDYGLYLDADMILTKNVIREAVNLLEQDSNINGLYIPEIVMGNSFWSKVRRFERSFYNATVIDCVRFIRMTTFHKVKGFDVTMTGPEDWDFDKKIRQVGDVDMIDAPIYHNESHFNISKYVSKKGYYAKSFDKYKYKWGRNDPDIQKQFGLYYRFIGVFIEHGKWKRLVSHPCLTLGMYFLRFLVGLAYLRT